jgi:hypothetical protein
VKPFLSMFVVAFAFGCSSCACGPTPSPRKPQGHYNAEDCATACMNLHALGCKTPAGKLYTDIVAGMTCDEGCIRKLLEGAELHTTCVANAKNCAEVDACAR